MAKLLALFTIIALVESFLLYSMGTLIGFWPTVAVVLITAVLGTVLAKREGLKVWRQWRDSLARGEMPEEGILGGVLVLLGGILLITPGVLTDVAGVVLLVPPTRRFVARILRERLEKRIAEGSTSFQYRVQMGDAAIVDDLRSRFGGAARGVVIDTVGEVVEERRREERRLEG